MIDLSREEVTIMSELSIGVAIAVTQSVWALIVPRSTNESAISFATGSSSQMIQEAEQKRRLGRNPRRRRSEFIVGYLGFWPLDWIGD